MNLLLFLVPRWELQLQLGEDRGDRSRGATEDKEPDGTATRKEMTMRRVYRASAHFKIDIINIITLLSITLTLTLSLSVTRQRIDVMHHAHTHPCDPGLQLQHTDAAIPAR